MQSIDFSGPVATITLDDCAALSRHAIAEGRDLLALLRACDSRDDIKVIVIKAGKEDFFAPLEDTPSGVRQSEWSEVYAGASGIYQTLCYSKKVTITAVQGRCAGAGSMLVLCSDLTIAARNALFHAPFAALPEANFVLAALTMRLNRAKAWMLDESPLDAAAALESGLVNTIVDDNPGNTAIAWATRIARIPLDGIVMSKLAVETCLDSQGVGQEFDMAGFYRASHDTIRKRGA